MLDEPRLCDGGDDGPAAPAATEAGAPAAARVLTPNRAPLEWRSLDLESLLPHDHRARAVWGFVVGVDLHEQYDAITAPEGTVGRQATDPRLLLALWLYATVEGVGGARALARERGLQRVRGRGRAKVLPVLLWYALAHNLLRIVASTAATAVIT